MGDATAPAISHSKNPLALVPALAQEKAGSHNTHPNVLAQVDATHKGNKQKF
jgi:hypothetical protein